MSSSRSNDNVVRVMKIPTVAGGIIVGKGRKTLSETEKITKTTITMDKGDEYDSPTTKISICGKKKHVENAEDILMRQLASTQNESECISSRAVCDFVENWKKAEKIKFEKLCEVSVLVVAESRKDTFVLVKGWCPTAVSNAKKQLIKMAGVSVVRKPSKAALPDTVDESGFFTSVLEVLSDALSSKSSGRKLKDIENDTNSMITRTTASIPGKKGIKTRFTISTEEKHDLEDAVKQLSGLLGHLTVKIVSNDDSDPTPRSSPVKTPKNHCKKGKDGNKKKSRTPAPVESSDSSSDDSEELTDSDTESVMETEAVPDPVHRKYPKMMNILVLGETGVGKSTFINGLVNYLKFGSMEEALNGEIDILIKSAFTLTDDDFQTREIITEPTIAQENGSSAANEMFGKGQSATQDPKSYVFRCGEGEDEKSIRIIDTPGIGDTRGLDQDKKNFEKILSFIADFSEIHGICILMKPNNARLTLAFRFCVDELLVHLHRSASQNIVFCFTNTRSTLYKPGDTLPTLREHLQKLEADRGIHIPLNKSTLFSFDNESFRFLCAYKRGFNFSKTDKSNFAGSWGKSVEEALRLFTRVAELPVHNVNDTLCLNNTRSVIITLARPLAEIARNQMINMKLIEDKLKEVEDHAKEGKHLRNNLYVDQIVMNAEELPYPQTVCTAASCVTHMRFSTDENSPMQTHYKTICHDHCYLTGVQLENCPNTILQGCWAMGGQMNCRICKCLWSTHMHLNYKLNQQMKKVMDPTVERSIQNKDDAVKTIQLFIVKEKQKIEQLRAESEKITSYCAEFAAFLSKNSILPYNDSYRQYIEHLIKEEREKVGAGGSDHMLKEMEKYKEEYEQQVRILKESMQQKARKTRSVDEMNRMVKELQNLQHCGTVLKEVKKLEMMSVRQTQKHMDSTVVLPDGWINASISYSKKQLKKMKKFAGLS